MDIEDESVAAGSTEPSSTEPSSNDSVTRSSKIKIPSDIDYISVRAAGLVFVLFSLILTYILLPVSDLLNIFSFEYDPNFRRASIFSVFQKLFFLTLGVFLLWQLKQLAEDFFTRRLEASVGADIQRDREGPYLENRTTINSDRPTTENFEVGGDSEEFFDRSMLEANKLDSVRIFKNFRVRVKRDISRLSSISTRNLFFGLGFSFAALFFIASPLIFAAGLSESVGDSAHQNADALNWLFRYYLPRFGVGLLLQFVGFFFLRLYVANEQDIKHNSNEITNLEAKMMALQVASDRNDERLIKPVIESLAATERNFILKRNEKAVHEDDRRYNDLNQLLQTLGNLVDKRQSEETQLNEEPQQKKSSRRGKRSTGPIS